MTETAIALDHLGHAYGGPQRLSALEDISLDIQQGQFVAIVGQSGCGKSTLLRILAGLISPSEGSALLHGQPVVQAVSQRWLSWMAQKPALLPWLSVSENLSLVRKLQPAEFHSALSDATALSMLELDEYASFHPYQLSGGMQQRLALARLLLLNSRVWLMDEPFSALDELTREQITAAFLRLWQERQSTVLWVTHHIAEAVKLADRIIVMSPRPGKIVLDHQQTDPEDRKEGHPAFYQSVQMVRQALGMNGSR